MLSVKNLTVCYDGHRVVNDLSFSLEEGQWLMLAGPNGAGKSTVIRALSQGTAYTGKIELEGKDIRFFRPAQLARIIGVLSQQHSVGYSYSVEEVVSLGRYAHRRSPFSPGDDGGEKLVDRALELTGLTHLRRASVLTLSGGELQRTFLAQVFAQDPPILVLDEPANHLDLVYQKHIFSLIDQWLKIPGRVVMSVVHDLSLARKYGTHAVLMNEGACVARGDIRQTLTRENLQAVYGMDVYGWMRDMLGLWEEEGDG